MTFQSINEGADFWYNDIGLNVIPADTQNKRPIINWKEYQEKPVSDETFEQWKKTEHLKKELRLFQAKFGEEKTKENI